jgi:hypothetical protein
MKRTSSDGLGSSISRRDWLKLSAAGFSAFSASGWIETLAARAAADPARKRACILLWMSGGPSQMDTFDMKPGHANGGTFKPIDTAVPGLQICEHLPKFAKEMKDAAVIRSMSTKEGDHGRATYYLRTGYTPQGGIQFPTMGSVLSKELEEATSDLPSFISVAPFKFLSPGAFGPGFLGPRYAPLVVGDVGFNVPQGNAYEQALKVADLDPPSGINLNRSDARLGLLEGVERDFMVNRPAGSPLAHRTAYERAVKMMRSTAAKAFDLNEEPGALRDAYGRNLFGQGCMLARRLVERGVPFVEVSLNGVDGGGNIGWDTHQQNFDSVKKLCGTLDPAWSTLIQDLRTRGMLESTLVVWMGEFGRTPQINGQGGRDHFPNAWTTVLAGGGVKGGQAHGKTSADGTMVADNPVTVPDFMSTVCKALGIDPMKQNMSDVGRPIRIAAPEAKPIKELLA